MECAFEKDLRDIGKEKLHAYFIDMTFSRPLRNWPNSDDSPPLDEEEEECWEKK